ncbi:MAG: M28 family peptidase [Flavobacteriales bacterium]
MKFPITLVLLWLAPGLQAQISNIACTSAAAEQAMKGQHDPADYAASEVISDHQTILCELRTRLSPDSLKAHLQKLITFQTRHTYSDTVSAATGIGAARRWAFGKFAEFSAANEDRLIPAYLQFDYQTDPDGCGDGAGWRDVMAVLPGSSTTNHRIVIIEAHLDSRCADNCDPACFAPGAEDNGSGVALVLELARVMSRYTFDHTLVFLLTIGEEHGLLGAEAMATYCTDQGIAIKAVQNNDVIGGILCGRTSSPPSCPGLGDVDSLQVRLFSHPSTSQPHRGYARTIKMYYEEKLRDHVPVPMTISVMNQEDRTNRGGDHIPFRLAGFRNVRFTAANEHGDGDPSQAGYDDRQHTSDDVLGVDTDGDLEVDSFFVDFNYLQRNAVINGMAATLVALGPETPDFIVHDEPTGLRVSITSNQQLPWFRIGVRGLNSPTYFDAVYRTSDTSFVVPGLLASHIYQISVAGIDADGIMSPFSREFVLNNDADTPPGIVDDMPFGIACEPIGMAENAASSISIELLSCQPNPFTDHTVIQVVSDRAVSDRNAFIAVCDVHGREVARLPVALNKGTNTVTYEHHGRVGIYPYRLVVDGRIIATRSMVVLP